MPYPVPECCRRTAAYTKPGRSERAGSEQQPSCSKLRARRVSTPAASQRVPFAKLPGGGVEQLPEVFADQAHAGVFAACQLVVFQMEQLVGRLAPALAARGGRKRLQGRVGEKVAGGHRGGRLGGNGLRQHHSVLSNGFV